MKAPVRQSHKKRRAELRALSDVKEKDKEVASEEEDGMRKMRMKSMTKTRRMNSARKTMRTPIMKGRWTMY